MEIGPYRLKDDHTLVYNDGSWNEFANVMFVDNPVGTGFSYVNTDAYVKELDEMADQFITFLEKWFNLFPEYEHDDVGGNAFVPWVFLFLTCALTDLPCWRIIRWPTHSLHCQAHTRPQQAPYHQAQVESLRPSYR